MARVSGIQLEKNSKGEILYVKVKYSKHLAEMKSFLDAKGLKQETTLNERIATEALTRGEFMEKVNKILKENYKDSDLNHIPKSI